MNEGDRLGFRIPYPVKPLPLALFLVGMYGLAPCTSGPLVLGHFFGWPWAVGGIVTCWTLTEIYGKIRWSRSRVKLDREGDDDVS